MSDVKMDPMTTDLTRRHLMFGLLLSAAMVTFAPAALADGGDDDGGGDDGGGGNSGSGGGSNSGSSGGDDDDNDEGAEDGEDGTEGSESERAQDAVKAKKAVPLRTLMSHLKKHYPGKVIDVDLKRSFLKYSYHVKILTSSGKVQRLRLNALTLQKI